MLLVALVAAALVVHARTSSRFVGTSSVPPAADGTHGAGVLPSSTLTPGATDPRVRQANIGSTICVAGYTKTVRPSLPESRQLKADRMAAYHVTGAASYELDHLISLELGGAPRDVRNLWPEPWEQRGRRLAAAGSGAESKDRIENALHAKVCAGAMTLAEAQRRIASDWSKA
jgi:hypothetical protein